MVQLSRVDCTTISGVHLKCVQSVPSVRSVLANHRACNKNCGFHSTGRFGRFGRFWNLKKWVTLKSKLLFQKRPKRPKHPKRPKRPEQTPFFKSVQWTLEKSKLLSSGRFWKKQTPFFKSVLGKPPGEAFEKSVLSLLFQILKCPEFAFLKSYRPGTLFWDLKVSQPWEVFSQDWDVFKIYFKIWKMIPGMFFWNLKNAPTNHRACTEFYMGFLRFGE